MAGVVQAPTHLLSSPSGGLLGNNGASLLGNNGGSLIGNNGGAYRLASALTQQPLGGVVVRLEDASGQPILGPDGKALEATTDAQGRYRFATAPTGHVVLRAVLPGGQLVAIATPDGGRGALGLDASSSLAAAYVLDQYVRGQASPGDTLARLTTQAEVDTRQAMTQALSQSSAALSALSPAASVAYVQALRGQNSALDQQLERVKQLLLAAGASNLGAGRDAKEVALGRITGLASDGAGGLWLLAPDDRRLWRLAADGSLRLGLGGGPVAPPAQLAGAQADAFALPSGAGGLVVDASGRAVSLLANAAGAGKRGAVRVETNGSLSLPWPNSGALTEPLAVQGDTLWALRGSTGKREVVRVQGTSPPESLAMLDAAASAFPQLLPSPAPTPSLRPGQRLPRPSLPSVRAYGAGPAGLWALVASQQGSGMAIWEGGAWVPKALAGASHHKPAPGGTWLERRSDWSFWQVAPDGAATQVADAGGASALGLGAASAWTRDAQGRVVAASASSVGVTQVKALVGGGAQLLAGSSSLRPDAAGAVSLLDPARLAAAAGGVFFVHDAGFKQILRVGGDGRSEAWVGDGQDPQEGDDPDVELGASAKTTRLGQLQAMAVAQDGSLLLATPAGRVVMVTPNGSSAQLVWTLPEEEESYLELKDLAVGPQGEVVALVQAFGEAWRWMRLPLFGFTATQGSVAMTDPDGEAFDPQAAHLLAPPGQALRFVALGSDPQTFEEGFAWSALVGTERGRFPLGENSFSLDGAPCFDAQGALVVPDYGTDTLWRLKADGSAQQLAGVDTELFGGVGVDDSLLNLGQVVRASDGALLLLDRSHRQVKRLPASRLPP